MFGGVALGAAVTAYFIAPLMQYANPAALALFGALAGAGLLGVYNVRVVPGVKPVADKVGWTCLMLGGGGVITALIFAWQASTTLDGYCAGIQSRMIAAEREERPIGDSKDIMQTLRCRPQEVVANALASPLPAALPEATSGSAARTR